MLSNMENSTVTKDVHAVFLLSRRDYMFIVNIVNVRYDPVGVACVFGDVCYNDVISLGCINSFWYKEYDTKVTFR